MVSRLRTVALIALPLLVLLLPACTIAGVTPTKTEMVKLKVAVSQSQFVSAAPFYIVEEEGFLAKQGLEIEYVKFDQTSQAIPALEQGQVDILTGSLSLSLLSAIARNATLKLVADRGNGSSAGCSYIAILARPDEVKSGKLGSAESLKGRRFAVNRANVNGYFLDTVLNRAGLTLGDIQPVTIPDASLGEALAKGSIDFVVASEPWITQIIQSGSGALWIPVRQVLPEFQVSVVVYGPNLLKGHPDLGKRFMVAYLQAVQQYNQGKTERNIDILMRRTETDRKVLDATCWPGLRSDGQLYFNSVTDFQKWALKYNLLDSLVKVEDFWDPSFIESAKKSLQ